MTFGLFLTAYELAHDTVFPYSIDVSAALILYRARISGTVGHGPLWNTPSSGLSWPQAARQCRKSNDSACCMAVVHHTSLESCMEPQSGVGPPFLNVNKQSVRAVSDTCR